MYEPYPTLKYCWNPKQSAPYRRQHNVQGAQGVDLGPHPADPRAPHCGNQADDEHFEGPNVVERSAFGTEIYVYSGRGG